VKMSSFNSYSSVKGKIRLPVSVKDYEELFERQSLPKRRGKRLVKLSACLLGIGAIGYALHSFGSLDSLTGGFLNSK
jgi:hypothetical protein